MLAAVFREAAPLDLRLLGRVVVHATAVGAIAGIVAAGFFYALEVATQLCIDVLAGYRTMRAAGELAMQPAVTVRPADDLRLASERMIGHGLRELIVVDDQRRIRGFIDEAEIGRVYLERMG